MPKFVVLEPSLRQSDARAVTLDLAVWEEMCEVGRKEGYHVSRETTIGPIDSKLFAAAVRRGMSRCQDVRPGRGSDRFTASNPTVLNEPGIRSKVGGALLLLESGGVVVNKRGDRG